MRQLQESMQNSVQRKGTSSLFPTPLKTPSTQTLFEKEVVMSQGVVSDRDTPQLPTSLLSRTSASPAPTPDRHSYTNTNPSTHPITSPQLNMSLSLDQFQTRHTSEDNASFETIMEKQREKNLQKHAWLFEKEREAQSQLMLTQSQQHSEKILALPSTLSTSLSTSSSSPTAELELELELAVTGKSQDTRPTSVVTWPYKARNDLMYEPDGLPNTAKENMEIIGGSPKEIVHSNTRFESIIHSEPVPLETKKQEIHWSQIDPTTPQILGKRRKEPSHIDLDDFYATPRALGGESPQVRGYGFVATPSPGPGLTDGSPITTWGRLDGTPQKLMEDALLSASSGPQFKVPDTPRREKVALTLTESSSRNRLRTGTRPGSAGTSGTSPSASSGLSPAAQRFANRAYALSNFGSDRQLRASYQSPQGSRKFSAGGASPGPSQNWPSSSLGRSSSPAASPAAKKQNLGTSTSSVEYSSLTDNLLNI
eukprot:TRINITY_DN2257_c0_g1_i1.p1 TRINITY_DN2257_c0_g1~~TRINITY_DN2257_c0_g1_i1.p1  ORF type:complete len:544 (+),score=133.11 TRINITY_DN2257_c0_g1_i1:190-1632(+)